MTNFVPNTNSLVPFSTHTHTPNANADKQEFAFYGQIQGRLGRVTRNEIKHSMVIVEDTSSNKVVGFLEIGMLPKPSSAEEIALAREARTTERAAAALAAAEAAAAATAGGKGKGKGKGDGKIDRKSSPPTATRLGADTATAATTTVDGIEEDKGQGESDTAIRRERQPDAAYLANVVVDRGQRRRGIGRTMVTSAIEIVKELWPAEDNIYVSVEQVRIESEGSGREGRAGEERKGEERGSE